MAPFREIQLSKFLYPNASSRFALLVLNEHLDYFPLQPLVQLWLHASWRICADGGANQVYDHLSSEPELQRRLIPNLILGDLDSLRTDVADFYRILGTKVDRNPCQDTTDFEKCLKALIAIEEQSHESPFDLLVLGGTKGRLDQVMANLNTLYSCLESPRQVFIVDQLNSVTLLGPGLHRIHCTFPLETLHCGLIPLEGEVKVKTSGLKWNLDNDILKFGHFISTSNQRLLEHTATDIPECFLPIHLSPVDDPMYTSPTKSVTPLHMNEGHQCSTVFIQCNGPLFWIQTLDLSQLETR